MVGLIDARSPEVYKLMTVNKRSDILPFLLSHRLSTFNHILCNPKRVFPHYLSTQH